VVCTAWSACPEESTPTTIVPNIAASFRLLPVPGSQRHYACTDSMTVTHGIATGSMDLQMVPARRVIGAAP
jgi:hypothetical protein